MFSTTTIASSTTRPTDSTIASRVKRFIVNPSSCIRNTPPISDTGIAMTGTITVRSEPRNRKITITTITIVCSSVVTTSSIASSMYRVASNAIRVVMPVGSSRWIAAISARTRSITSSELAFGSTHTPMNTASSPENRTVLIVVLGAERDLGDVLEPDQRAALRADHQLLELVHGLQIGRRRDVDLDERALGLADRREVVVGGERRADLRRADPERRHPIGLEPRAHRERARPPRISARCTPWIADSRGWTTRIR